jgi:integrase
MLNVWRRHLRGEGRCHGSHEPDSRNGEFEERKKTWKKCGCPIIASGIWDSGDGRGRRFQRKSTECDTWDAARAVADAWEKGAPIPEPPKPEPPKDEKPRKKIDEAITLYHNHKRSRGITDSSFAKYRGFTTQLKKFADDKGYTYLDQFTVSDGDEFYESWSDGPTSRGKKLERAKGFWKFCLKRHWIKEHPMESIDPPVGYSVVKPKMPFTDEELDRIMGAAGEWQDREWHDGRGHHGLCSKEQMVGFIWLSTETGLRISDVCQFDVAERVNMETGDCFLRMHKTKKPLYTWLPPDLRELLQELALKYGPCPFDLPSKDLEHKTEVWRTTRLAKMFEAAGPFETKPTPHRFRHTFVRILLERGTDINMVAELAGDTVEMIRKHYAPWVPELNARLTEELKRAYEANQKKKWRARVVPIKARRAANE